MTTIMVLEFGIIFLYLFSIKNKGQHIEMYFELWEMLKCVLAH